MKDKDKAWNIIVKLKKIMRKLRMIIVKLKKIMRKLRMIIGKLGKIMRKLRMIIGKLGRIIRNMRRRNKMNKGSIIIPQSIVLQPYYIKMNKEKAEELTISFFK